MFGSSKGRAISQADVQKMSPRQQRVLKAGIISTDVPDFAQSSVAGVMGSIRAALPDVNVVLIQLLSTIVNGVILVLTPLYPAAIRKITRRMMLWIAFICYLVGSLGPIWFHDIYVMLFFRCILGVAAAICTPITTDYIVNLYEGREQRSMLGYSQCVAALGSIFFMQFGGILADIAWYYSFVPAMIAVPFFIYALATLPEIENPPVINTGAPKERTALRDILHLPAKAWLMTAFMFLWGICLNGYILSLSLIVVGEGIATAAVASAIILCNSIVRMILSGLYEKVHRLFKRWLLVVSALSFCLGLFICAIAQTVPLFAVGSVFIGIGNGLTRPGMTSAMSMTVPKHLRTKSVSFGYTAQSLGTFISAFVFAFIHALTGTTQGRATLWLAEIMTLFFAAAIMAYCFKVFKPSGEVKKEPA
ncbi:MAG: MFS transporter [Clostridia bacterium]|nr:MFS transporter [Clostridia bacterium]